MSFNDRGAYTLRKIMCKLFTVVKYGSLMFTNCSLIGYVLMIAMEQRNSFRGRTHPSPMVWTT